jgi:hypothetical protein
MPSPFPGMDPFIESQMWEDFHTDFITVLRQMLVSKVRPQYTVNVERYVYVTRDEDVVAIVAPDVAVAGSGAGWRESAALPVATLQPVKHQIAMPELRLHGRRGIYYRAQSQRRRVCAVPATPCATLFRPT